MNHPHSTCLNCDHEVTLAYCPNCGQKGDTHRLSFMHFFAHDLLHGLFHLDKGLLFTLKQVMICPGKAALNYIAGKRKAYYNFFYLILLMIGLYAVLGKFNNHYFFHDVVENKLENSLVNKFFSDYGKFILFGFMPIVSFNSWILYRRAKFNYLEHVIVAVQAFLGVLAVCIIDRLIEPLELLNVSFINRLLTVCFALAFVFYTCFSFFQAFRTYYSRSGLLWRTSIFLLLVVIESIILIIMIIGLVVGWNGEPIFLEF